MASISTDKRGNRTIQFVAGDRKRRSIRLGEVDLESAREVRDHVDALNSAAIAGQHWKRDLAVWVRSLDVVLYDKLAAVGLVVPRLKPNTTLGEFLAGYVRSRSDVKDSTATVYGHTRRNLVEYFGADKRIADITAGEARDWRRWLAAPKSDIAGEGGQGLARNTVNRRCGIAKQFFADAVDRKLIDESPFARMKDVTVRANRERDFFLSRADAAKLLKACPDAQWKLLVALSRFGGLRCPSEHLALTWGDVHWDRGLIRVRSPKTEHHEGKGERLLPLFPELRPYLQAVLDELLADFDPKAKRLSEQPVITRYREHKNLATQLKRIIVKAGLTAWPKVWHNMRATRQTELQEDFPTHVVCAWLGNSERVATKHYLQVTDAHFDRATAPTAVQHGAGTDRNRPCTDSESPENLDVLTLPVGDAGLEPATSTL